MSLAAAIAAGLTACASHPDQIRAVEVSTSQYEHYDCEQISMKLDLVANRTAELYTSLREERSTDAAQTTIGLLLFFPALLFLEGGDGLEAEDYARLKGQYEALQDVAVAKKCEVSSRSPRQIVAEMDAERKAREAADDRQFNLVR